MCIRDRPSPSWQCLLYATSRIMSTTSRDARNINNIQARFSKIHCKKAKIYPIPYSRVRVCAYMRMCGGRWTRAHVVCFYCKMRYNWCVSTTNVVVNSKTQSILCKMASRAPRAIAAYGFKYQMIFYSSPDTGKKSRKITVMRLLDVYKRQAYSYSWLYGLHWSITHPATQFAKQFYRPPYPWWLLSQESS